jgi:hypothetical protein
MTKRDAALAAPAGRFPAAMVMLFLSVSGMAIGLAIDCGVTPPALLAALCAAPSGGLAATLSFHVAVMPASYAMMAMAAVVSAAFGQAGARRGPPRATLPRVVGSAAAVVAMLLGMFAGGWLAPDAAALFGAEPGFGPLVTGMVSGMTAATLAAAGIATVLDAATARAKPMPAQYIMYQ